MQGVSAADYIDLRKYPIDEQNSYMGGHCRYTMHLLQIVETILYRSSRGMT